MGDSSSGAHPWREAVAWGQPGRPGWRRQVDQRVPGTVTESARVVALSHEAGCAKLSSRSPASKSLVCLLSVWTIRLSCPAFYSPYGFRMIWRKGPKNPCDLRKRARVARMICTGGLTETRTKVLKNSQKCLKTRTNSQNPSGCPGQWQTPL
jgi:hypothetical protein